MNFFEAQDSARRSTRLLILLFVLAIVGLLVLSNVIVFEFLYFREFSSLSFSLSQLALVFDADLCVLVSTAIIGFICLGSLYKLAQLSSGGSVIAQYLGGVIVPRSSSDPLHQKILNVVEEMAIASGMPVPQVYILNEPGINAFAAGWKTTNAVIGITQGALERLNRDELQGVIAHEFSHIFNGDMRLNIRLIAILHGILMMGLLGRMLIRSVFYSRSVRSSRNGQGALLFSAAGVALIVVGFFGTFFGNWIKSLISRQREYLADASAVQYTRSSEGIANALKKIGGAVPGSALLIASVDEYSHAYFALGDTSFSFFTLATHPPLKKRILRIQPGWDGKYLFDERKPARAHDEADQPGAAEHRKKTLATTLAGNVAINVGMGVSLDVALNTAINSLDEIGNVSQEQLDAAHTWHQALAEDVLAHIENPYSAQALVFALLVHDQAEIEKQQYDVLNEIIGELHANNVRHAQHVVNKLTSAQTLSLIDLALPTLREMTIDQYERFQFCVQKLISADKKVEVREWFIQRVVLQHLNEHYGLRKKPVAKYFVLGSAKHSSEIILSMLAYVEHPDADEAKLAFDGAKRTVGLVALRLLPKSVVSLDNLNTAMDDLEQLKPPLKKRFLQACVNCISHDGKVTMQAYELTRTIASCLDCPMPPVLVNKN